MNAYLAPIDDEADDVRRVVIDDPVGIYRSGYDVMVETDDQTIDLDVQDSAVSRKREDRSPVLVERDGGSVTIRNVDSTNRVLVDDGRREHRVEKGESRRVTSDSRLTLGTSTDIQVWFDRSNTLSQSDLEDELGLEQDGALISGVDPALYAQSLTDNLTKACDESPNKCLQYANELHAFLMETPVDDERHADVSADVNRIIERLEAKVESGALQGSGIDDQWRNRIERTAHEIKRLYARGETQSSRS
jgi:hypothetical protein